MLLSSQGKAATASATNYLWANDSGPWDTDRLTRIMTAETAERLGSRLTTAKYRHVAVRIRREVVGERFATGYNKQLDGRSIANSGARNVSLDEDKDSKDLVEL